ncbi:MAG: (2Fe-2S) ferredoxin domain-containing protein [Spirochaetota bacterium]|nr:MAG: (2Fe-2S) ferredoxin domain-containing protein [Spirochaetota bacterium]
MNKDRKLTVTVCVGSSCHIKGARDVIMRFNELLKGQNLEDKVELKGSFCMERCGEGINWQINEEPLTSANVDDAIRVFNARIVKPIKGET